MTRHIPHQSGYLGQSRHSPSGLAIVIGLHGAAIAFALLAKSGVIPIDKTGDIIDTFFVEPERPPEPLSEQRQPEPDRPPLQTSETRVQLADPDRILVNDAPFVPDRPIGPPDPTINPPPPAPVMVSARFTRSALAALQPRYPSILLRQDLEGSCTIRVRIAPDGRVTAAEPVDATHPAFCEATQHHALRRWRFEPATRDGVPIESWQQHIVEFRIS
ncbi:MAG: TonB family protein [Parasphingopyxis sp.]|uniref:energy transducer TonB n=1 Tax=Parasphingopyxis sp. TaxID=1920299 RepID=UPI003F9FE1EA